MDQRSEEKACRDATTDAQNIAQLYQRNLYRSTRRSYEISMEDCECRKVPVTYNTTLWRCEVRFELAE